VTNDERDNLLLYAAGALSDAEAVELRSRLAAASPEEIGVLAEAEAVLAHLPLALPEESPSVGAKSRLMGKLTAHGQTSSSMRIGPAVTSTGSTSSTRVPLWMALAASVLIFAVSLVMVMNAHRGKEDLRQQARAADEERATLQTALVTKELTLQNMQTKLALMTDSISAEKLQLVGLAMPEANAQRKTRGRILWDKDKNQWFIAVFDLAPPAAGREYELWFITPDQKKHPSKVFNTNAAGDAMMMVEVPKELGPIALAAITDEPAGGSPVPTGSIHLVGKVE